MSKKDFTLSVPDVKIDLQFKKEYTVQLRSKVTFARVLNAY